MTLTWLGLGILGLVLCAPLLYALRTLLGMQHKIIYPLLRTGDPQLRNRSFDMPMAAPTPHREETRNGDR